MSTPTAMTFPDVWGATSVCSSPARLPVASKKRGRSTLMAAAVVTSKIEGEEDAEESSFRTFAFEPPQEIRKLTTLKSSRPKPAKRNILGDTMSYLVPDNNSLMGRYS